MNQRKQIRSFEDLMVWQMGIELVKQVYLLTGAPESASSQRGGSPLQADALRPVTKCNCDAAMRGGEQQEVNDQSVG
jgi:hypothetical protein